MWCFLKIKRVTWYVLGIQLGYQIEQTGPRTSWRNCVIPRKRWQANKRWSTLLRMMLILLKRKSGIWIDGWTDDIMVIYMDLCSTAFIGPSTVHPMKLQNINFFFELEHLSKQQNWPPESRTPQRKGWAGVSFSLHSWSVISSIKKQILAVLSAIQHGILTNSNK